MSTHNDPTNPKHWLTANSRAVQCRGLETQESKHTVHGWAPDVNWADIDVRTDADDSFRSRSRKRNRASRFYSSELR